MILSNLTQILLLQFNILFNKQTDLLNNAELLNNRTNYALDRLPLLSVNLTWLIYYSVQEFGAINCQDIVVDCSACIKYIHLLPSPRSAETLRHEILRRQSGHFRKKILGCA